MSVPVTVTVNKKAGLLAHLLSQAILREYWKEPQNIEIEGEKSCVSY
jgi:hypothetical protein